MKIRTYLPHFIVFITSMCVMIIEILASRIVAKHFGNSLYTWTAVIGVILAGISLGNYLGGKIADRFRPEKTIGLQLIFSSALVLLIIPLDPLLFSMASFETEGVAAGKLALMITWIVVLFLLPSTGIGSISPVMAKFAIEQSTKIGNTVGGIYAISSIGSIVGTFLAGYLLIPLVGIRLLLLIIAAILGLLALVVGAFRYLAIAPLLLTFLLALLLPQLGFSTIYGEKRGMKVLFEKDSSYSHIVVQEVPKENYLERQLIMDGLIHNKFDPERPSTLLYDYEILFEAITRATEIKQMKTLTLGGGAALFPAFLMNRYPLSTNTVVEIDPEVIRVAETFFNIRQSSRLSIIEGDARAFVKAHQSSDRFDLIYLDAFDSYSVPPHLTTREFLLEVSAILKTDGFFLANCVDIADIGLFIGSFVKTCKVVFPWVSVYVDSQFHGDTRSTFVVVAGNGELPPGELHDSVGRKVGYPLDEERLSAMLKKRRVRLLTDDHAPVENLIAPVFLQNID